MFGSTVDTSMVWFTWNEFVELSVGTGTTFDDSLPGYATEGAGIVSSGFHKDVHTSRRVRTSPCSTARIPTMSANEIHSLPPLQSRIIIIPFSLDLMKYFILSPVF